MCCHPETSEEEPFVNFGPLFTLHKKNGVDINPTYDNHVS